jgi:hypothetical protein
VIGQVEAPAPPSATPEVELAAVQENYLHVMCGDCQYPVYLATGVAHLLCGAVGSNYTPQSHRPHCVICDELSLTGCPDCGAKMVRG